MIRAACSIGTFQPQHAVPSAPIFQTKIMDPAVINAMAKWPNVPACYGWLALDARGRWRLGVENSEIVRHTGLAAFLSRNYVGNDSGEWFCQNGPQRVFVTLETTPFVLHLDVAGQFNTHTGQPIEQPSAALIDASGRLYIVSELGVSAVDDRDLGRLFDGLSNATGQPASDTQIEALLQSAASDLWLSIGALRLPVSPTRAEDLSSEFGFQRNPLPAG